MQYLISVCCDSSMFWICKYWFQPTLHTSGPPVVCVTSRAATGQTSSPRTSTGGSGPLTRWAAILDIVYLKQSCNPPAPGGDAGHQLHAPVPLVVAHGRTRGAAARQQGGDPAARRHRGLHGRAQQLLRRRWVNSGHSHILSVDIYSRMIILSPLPPRPGPWLANYTNYPCAGGHQAAAGALWVASGRSHRQSYIWNNPWMTRHDLYLTSISTWNNLADDKAEGGWQ